jgi:hypothetical protein
MAHKFLTVALPFLSAELEYGSREIWASCSTKLSESMSVESLAPLLDVQRQQEG